MEEENYFKSFVSIVTNMPHIFEHILRYLGPVDIANCLSSSKIFRHIVSRAVQWNKQLQHDLDDQVSMMILTSRSMDTKNFGILFEVDADTTANCGQFGFDGSFWICRSLRSDPENSLSDWNCDNYNLETYDLGSSSLVQSRKVRRIFTRLKVRFLPGSKIMIQDMKMVMVFRPGLDTDLGVKTYSLASQKTELNWPHFGFVLAPKKPFQGDDCMFGLVRTEEQNVCQGITFYTDDCDGDLLGNYTNFRCKPSKIRKRGNLVLVDTSGEGITMFDTSKSAPIWNNQSVSASELSCSQMFMTESFCGLMYYSIEERSRYSSSGFFKLILLDNLSGKELYHENCWSYYISWREETTDFLPRVVASGNYLLACSVHGGDKETCRVERNNTFVCARVYPKKQTCVVRKSSAGFEPVLLEEALKSEHAIGKLGHPQKHEDGLQYFPLVAIVPNDFKIIGFASNSVAIGQVSFHFYGQKSTFEYCKTVFTVDLDKLLTMFEPSSVFSAIHFPLKENILENYGKEYKDEHELPVPEYYPHYQTLDSGEVKLGGILEVFEEKGHLMTNLHSFRKRMEVGDISSCSSSQSFENLTISDDS